MTAVNGVNGVNKAAESGWKVGLINYAQKYLTAESFGCKINVSGTGLKKKQTFVLVQDPVEEVLYIRSHLGRYVSADKYGNVTCEVEEPDQTEKFVVEYAKDGSGKWAFKNQVHGNYLGGTDDSLKCFAKTVTDRELWTVQLSIHPQVHLRNVNRKRYAHVCEDQLQVTQTIPWGEKSLLFLDFVDGKYALKTYDSRYLSTTGELSPQLTEACKFTLEIRSGQNGGLAFRDSAGCYLTGVGATATMKGRNKTVGKDELFTLEDTHPQVVLIAYNGKKVSIKQGVDVSANQEDEETDKEIFQMEYERSSGRWAFRTVDNKYWSLEPLGGVQGVGSSICPETLFEVEWLDDGSIVIKANNNSYIYNKPTGSLTAGSDSATDKEKFRVKIVNRPILVLRSDFGFVGAKSPGAAKADVVCNRTTYEVIYVESASTGAYLLKAANGKYWAVGEDGAIVADGSAKTQFWLQFRGNSMLTILADNGCFIKGEQNGLFRAVGREIDQTVLWEF
ncbi:LOW QUALITY PROTEIN: protein singed-like [Pomacea canaliculata]|uniref:LOW QUALITY PROTEIN: protein singed-like n=1 Tax=Pomacea canaliculata TaxID=400727 RepID=UPI000D727AF3|nr:LOW QUALITY PROTEIN: protein singed-like [Pomacea canaliculata]